MLKKASLPVRRTPTGPARSHEARNPRRTCGYGEGFRARGTTAGGIFQHSHYGRISTHPLEGVNAEIWPYFFQQQHGPFHIPVP